MVQKIPLRNEKSASLILGILALGLGGVILYWGLFVKMRLEVSGADLDPSTSAVLAVLISIGPLLAGIHLLIRFFSITRYGDFAVVMGREHITYPVGKFMRGYQKYSLEKSKLHQVRIESRGANDATLFLNNEQGAAIGVISNTLIPYHQISGMQLAEKIQAWLNEGR